MNTRPPLIPRVRGRGDLEGLRAKKVPCAQTRIRHVPNRKTQKHAKTRQTNADTAGTSLASRVESSRALAEKLIAQSKMSCGTPSKEPHARHKTGLAHETSSPARGANSRTLADSSLAMQDGARPRRKQPPAAQATTRSRRKVEARIRYKKAARVRRAALSTRGYATGDR